MSKIAVDTNVLVYLYNLDDITKREISETLLLDRPFISSQVVSEYLNVSRRLLKLEKSAIMEKCCSVFNQCFILPVSHSVLKTAGRLIATYDFKLFNSIIVAAALEAGCHVLYSEDMHHGLIVEKTLSILNPFL